MRRLPSTTDRPGSKPTSTDPALLPPAPSAPPRWAGREILDAPETALVLNAVWSGDPAVVVPSPPGAGKTRLVALLAAALTDAAELRVGIAAQTRAQAVEIARRVGILTDRAVLGWAADKPLPDVPGVQVARGQMVSFPGEAGGVVIATTARWMVSKPHILACDVMLVDEAWQATFGDIGALGAFAPQIVCVGDPGQIAPVVTGSTDRWRSTPSGPHVPAPEALVAAHPAAVTTVALPHTWRLGPATTALIQPAFYPQLPFSSRRPAEHIESPGGVLLPEISTRLVTVTGGSTDPALIAACADRVRELIGHRHHTSRGVSALAGDSIAVVCAHVSQAAAVRAALSAEPDVLVGTANQLQGLERPAVVALHPL